MKCLCLQMYIVPWSLGRNCSPPCLFSPSLVPIHGSSMGTQTESLPDLGGGDILRLQNMQQPCLWFFSKAAGLIQGRCRLELRWIHAKISSMKHTFLALWFLAFSVRMTHGVGFYFILFWGSTVCTKDLHTIAFLFMKPSEEMHTWQPRKSQLNSFIKGLLLNF